MRKLLNDPGGVLCWKPGMEEKLRNSQSSLAGALERLSLQSLAVDANDVSLIEFIRARTVEIDQAMKEQRAFVKREDVRKAGETPIALGLSSTSD